MARRIEKSRLYRPFYLYGYEKSQWLPRRDSDLLVNRSLRSLVNYAYRNVPYYHRVMKNRGIAPGSVQTAQDLTKLPILTKALIRENFDSLISKAVPPEDRVRLRTGGSTGEPLEFCSTLEADARLWASMLRSRFWQGVVRTHRMVSASGTIPERNEWKKNEMYVSAFDISEEAFADVVQKMRKFQPKFVTGYAGYLSLLAEHLTEHRVTDIRPIAIETQSEMVLPHMRKAIEDAFGCTMFDHYGCKETTIKACECSRHEGLHVAVENGILEAVVDGEQAVDETGSLLMTDFWNRAMPFIRYDVGDLGVIGEETCSCGRSLPLLRSIKGRINDVVVLADGKALPGEFFPHILKDVRGIKQYQVVQESLDSIIIRIVPRQDFNSTSEQTLLSNLTEWIGEEIRVRVVLEDDIPLSRTGKHKIVESRVGGGK